MDAELLDIEQPYHGYTAEQAPDAASFLHALVEETRVRRDALVHGDYAIDEVATGG